MCCEIRGKSHAITQVKGKFPKVSKTERWNECVKLRLSKQAVGKKKKHTEACSASIGPRQ